MLFVGAGTCGRANGAMHIISKAQAFIAERGLPVEIVEVGCVGYCQREVFVDLQTADGLRLSYCDLSPENIEEFLEALFVKNDLRNRFLYGRYGDSARLRRRAPGRRHALLQPTDPSGAGQLRSDRPRLP